MTRSARMSLAVALAGMALGGPASPAFGRGALPAETGSAPSGDRLARAARASWLEETGHLHLTSRHNFTLNEQGSAVGTVRGAIYVHLTAVSSSRVVAEVNIYAQNGSISGKGAAAYRRMGKTASFSGSMSIGHGSGQYARVHGSGIRFSGTILESNNDAIVVRVSGRVYY